VDCARNSQLLVGQPRNVILGIGSERIAIDLFSRITKLPPLPRPWCPDIQLGSPRR
jgi:hypothetical protein